MNIVNRWLLPDGVDEVLPPTAATLEKVRDNTGFDFDCPDDVGMTPPPEPDRLEIIRGRVAREIAETYPEFAAEKLGYQGD